MTTNPQVFEFRFPETNNVARKNKRGEWLVAAIGLLVVLAALLFSAGIEGGWWQHEPAQSATNESAAKAAPLHYSTQGGLDGAKKSPPHIIDWWRILYPLCFSILPIAVLLARHVLPKRYVLTLTDNALTAACRLPLGLERIFPVNWQISLRDIAAVESVQIPVFNPNPIPVLAQIRIGLRDGTTRSIAPASWFIPGSPARPPLTLANKWGMFVNPSRTWLEPQSQAILQMAFSALPLVQALREKGIAVPDPTLPANFRDQDLFSCRSTKFGIAAGIALALGAIVIMSGYNTHHLLVDLPLRVYAMLGGIALLLLWLVGRHDARRPPLSNSIAAAVIIVAGSAMAAQPFAVFINGIGMEPARSQAFVAHAGNLEPVAGPGGIAPADWPESLTDVDWIKEGTTISLSIKKGRLGLWEFDDTPLRGLPDSKTVQRAKNENK